MGSLVTSGQGRVDKELSKGYTVDANVELPDIEFLLPFIASLIMS